MNIVNSILIFSLIIVIHELGHFLLAKKNGIYVTEFSIGMGPRIISFVKTEKGYRPRFFLNQHDFDTTEEWKNSTKYSWKILPIGGSCMMMGEDEKVDDDRAFNKKGVWARISVIFAGPLFNFILAFVLAIFIIGVAGYDPATITNVANNSQAEEAGIQPGDVLTKIDGKRIDISRDADTYLQFTPLNGEEVTLTYSHEGEKNTVSLIPVMVKTYWMGFSYDPKIEAAAILDLYEDLPMANAGLQVGDVILKINDVSITDGNQLGEYIRLNPLSEEDITITYSREGEINTAKVTPVLRSEMYSLGFSLNSARVKTDVFGVLKYSAVEVKYWIATTVKSLSQLIAGKVSTKELAGPVGIVSMIGTVIDNSDSLLDKILSAANFCILLSANLGVMNLLPIPALDGGRLVFLFIELFRGKPVDQEKEGLVHMIGLVALMILMVFVMYNDISRLFQ